MKKYFLVFAIVSVFMLSGCAPQVDVETDAVAIREIQAVLDRYEKALNTSDVDAVLELYADDGVFMPSSAPTAVGIESVRATYEYVFSTSKLDIAFTVEEIVADGSVAFARTGSKESVTVLADGSTAPEENRELFVFQKEDGVWKIARYMFNKTS